MSVDERAFQWTGGGDGDLDAANADSDEGAKLQEFEPDGSGGRLCQLSSLQRYAAQGCHQHVSERREP